MPLQDRVALITGAGSGIGRAAALRLAREGARIAALSRTADEVERVAEEIRRAGGDALALTADIGHAGEMEQAVGKTLDRWNRLDILFANAGVNGVWAPIEEIDPEEWERTIRINLVGTFLTIKYAVPALKRKGGAVIVNASINGTRIFSNIGASAYASSKAGQVALAKMLALELAKHRIRVNVICPGAIATEIDENTERRDLDREKESVKAAKESKIPLTRGRPGQAEQVAELVLFLASDASDHISGTEVWIDGAQSLLGPQG